MVLFRHEKKIICSKTEAKQNKLDDIAHEQTITCRQLFAGHVVGFWPVKRKNDNSLCLLSLRLVYGVCMVYYCTASRGGKLLIPCLGFTLTLVDEIVSSLNDSR